jgi:hypothetical protein
VPLQKADVHGKGTYPLRSEMSALEYLTDAPHACTIDDTNVIAFTEATTIIGGRDAVEEFLTCGIWPLSDNWEFEVEMMESPHKKLSCRCQR